MDIVIVGIDLGKNSCSLAGLDASGRVVSTDISRMNPELEADYSDFLRFPEVPPPFVAGCAQSGPGMVFPGPV